MNHFADDGEFELPSNAMSISYNSHKASGLKSGRLKTTSSPFQMPMKIKEHWYQRLLIDTHTPAETATSADVKKTTTAAGDQ